jgi:transketolase
MTVASPLLAQPTFDCRKAFTEQLLELARADERIVVVCNDSVGSSNLDPFLKEFPERLINVGIAEQNMVGVGAGLANAGYIPFISAAAPFLTGRATEQVKVDAGYNGYHMVLCGQSPGIGYGPLGPTHHSIEDFAWTRAIDGLNVIAPSDPRETRQALVWAVANPGPSYIRISRHGVPEVTPADSTFQLGKALTLRDGKDITLIATGITVCQALVAADLLAAKGIQARVLDMATVKPLDVEAVVKAAKETGRIVTVEEAIVYGGLGGAVAEAVVQHAPVPMKILGFPGFCPTGDVKFLLNHFGLDAEGIARAATELVG